MEIKLKKITLTTIKNFVSRELANDNLYIKTLSSFDAMTDSIKVDNEANFSKAEITDWSEKSKNNTLRVRGIWIVRRGNDYFTRYTDEQCIGYRISNCCGSFIIAMKRLV